MILLSHFHCASSQNSRYRTFRCSSLHIPSLVFLVLRFLVYWYCFRLSARVQQVSLAFAALIGSPGAVREHPEYNQVELDVARSLWKWPTDANATERKDLREQLSQIIHAILIRHPDLHYYQGFHDVVSVLLLVVGDEAAFHMTEALVIAHFRDCMGANLSGVVAQLDLIFPLLAAVDAELAAFIRRSEVPPHFALSWVMTWFSHDLEDFAVAQLVFDFCLASHPLMPIYLAVEVGVRALVQECLCSVCFLGIFSHSKCPHFPWAGWHQVVRYHRDLIMQTECDFPMVHTLLCSLPLKTPLADIFAPAIALMEVHPPPALLRLSGIPQKSRTVLQTCAAMTRYHEYLRAIDIDPEALEIPTPTRADSLKNVMAISLGLAVCALSVFLANDFIAMLK
eukprot:m.424946 g.424946  ORF g.424946 m.424946 type:complete len:396 (+) comp56680_c0_seq11:3-1190(+)